MRIEIARAKRWMKDRQYYFWWCSKPGTWIKNQIFSTIGYWFLLIGQSILKRTYHRCSLCGRITYMDSVISEKGCRCNTMDRNCHKIG